MNQQMTPERWDKIEQLFHSAAERTGEDRAQYLNDVCAGDAELQREVESLLAHGKTADGWLGGEALKKMAEEFVDGAGGVSLSGQRLGPYQVLEAIGAGGMGEVYRARDTRLNRLVAIKVLPAAFANDPARLARFQREAKILAALNHPNIATIYGLEQSNGTAFLVMELVGGETLAERIKRTGLVPVEEALPIARQIADALECAHDNNVIHRDLKPANIKVTSDGTVKVLDFGLAKAVSEEVNENDISNSPTLSRMTRQGVILGTAAYMSPEQARGKPVDRRTDVWAFGALLYEMLTGEPAFDGEDVTEVLAAVVKSEPRFEALPTEVPPAIRKLVRRCLEKNVRRRLGHICEARIVIDDVLSGAKPEESFDAPAAHDRRERLVLGGALALALAGMAAVSFVHFRETPPTAQPEVRTEISTPSGIDPSSLALSPDGRQIVFVASGSGPSQLWLRRLDVTEAAPLVGTVGASHPFWSPDSHSIGFFAEGKLKRMDIAGGHL